MITEIISLINDGLTLTMVRDRLEAQGVPSRRGGEWTVTTLSRILRRLSEPYARAADGTPYFLPEIVKPTDLARAKAILAERSFKAKPKVDTTRRDSTMLLYVGYCQKEHKLWASRSWSRGVRFNYYRCYKCPGARRFRMEELDAVADRWVSFYLGDVPWLEPVYMPASDHERELDDVLRRIDDIEAQIVGGDMPAASGARMLAKLEARRMELDVPTVAARTEYRETGKTLAEYWAGLDKHGRGHALREMAARITPWHDEDGLHVLCESEKLSRLVRADVSWVHAPGITSKPLDWAA